MVEDKVDILAIAAHPDDVELAASGTLLKHIAKGLSVAIVDLTLGELGTRGNAELRTIEAQRASEILGISSRHQLDLGDCFFDFSEENLKQVVTQIRRYQPKIILTNALHDRHPDHGRGGDLVARACFLSGLVKVKTEWNGADQDSWRPNSVYRFVQDNYIQPDFVVDVTEFWETRMKSVLAYSSQFYDPLSVERESPISSKEFLAFLEGRAMQFGRLIGAKYGEGFTVERPIGVENLIDIK
ncbi:MAG: bacillithiol biosynthesis deacetylase BshB1 [Flavobacteriales bacterium]|nr:bacillithiol biosynthesis deacetylase BshB1 [Flavobacteriales bacterium]